MLLSESIVVLKTPRMSGLEVAGIVLAVVPLFVIAAEHSGSNIVVRGRGLLQRRRQLKSFLEALGLQQAKLYLYVTAILRRTHLSESEQSLLLRRENLGSDLWTQDHIVGEFDGALGVASEPFRGILTRIVNELVQCLDRNSHLRNALTSSVCLGIESSCGC